MKLTDKQITLAYRSALARCVTVIRGDKAILPYVWRGAEQGLRAALIACADNVVYTLHLCDKLEHEIRVKIDKEAL